MTTDTPTVAASPPSSAAGRQRHRETVRVTLLGAVVDAALTLAKVAGGFAANSQALIADGVHSASDLVTDSIVIAASRHANKEADEEHPYGHGRIETLATMVLATTMLGVAAALCANAVEALTIGITRAPESFALVIAALSVVSKEAVYHYTMRVARTLDSNMLRANAWHSRTDALSSIVVVLGVGGALAGYPLLDAVAAIVVALMIAHVGVKLIWRSVQELIDTGLSADQVDRIRNLIQDTEGVANLHMLRTRSLGSSALADVHIQVSPRISVSEGHQISEEVEQRLIANVRSLNDVTVHTDPEDDETAPDTKHLPPRSLVLAQLRERLGDDLQQVIDTRLHYLDGALEIELVLRSASNATAADLQEYQRRIVNAVAALPAVSRVSVLHQIALQ